jgi:hypothetical protein
MFSGVEVRGLDRVVECVKQHPVVLVPCPQPLTMVLSYIFASTSVTAAHRRGHQSVLLGRDSPLRGSGRSSSGARSMTTRSTSWSSTAT